MAGALTVVGLAVLFLGKTTVVPALAKVAPAIGKAATATAKAAANAADSLRSNRSSRNLNQREQSDQSEPEAELAVNVTMDPEATSHSLARAEGSEALTLPVVSIDSRPTQLQDMAAGVASRALRSGPSLADFFNLKALLSGSPAAALDGSEAADADGEEAEESEENYLVAKAKETVEGLIAEKLAGLPASLVGDAGGKLVESLQGALEQVSVGKDILAMAWKNAAELIEYRDLTIHTPVSHFVVPLTDHEITLDQAATIEIVFGEKTLLTLEFPIQFVVRPSDITIEMRAGRIERVSVGAAVATGSLSLDDRPLLEVPERAFPLGRLDAGVPIA